MCLSTFIMVYAICISCFNRISDIRGGGILHAYFYEGSASDRLMIRKDMSILE